MKRARTIVVGASHCYRPFYADMLAAHHEVIGLA
jgi:hypothetical protein